MEHKRMIYFFRDAKGLWILGNTGDKFGFFNATNVNRSPRFLSASVGSSLMECKRNGVQAYEHEDIIGVLKNSKILNEKSIQKFFNNINTHDVAKRLYLLTFVCLWLVGIASLVMIRPPFHVGIIMGFFFTGILLRATDRVVKRLIYGNW